MEQSARLPPQGAVTGWAALRLAGANFFDGLDVDGCTRMPVLLAVGSDSKVRADAAASVSREPLSADEVVVRHGVPCTRVVRALFDEMRRASDWREAVVAMDMAAAADLVSIHQLWAYAAEHSRWRRTRHVVRALAHASELSRSPNESRMRLVWVVDAGCRLRSSTGRSSRSGAGWSGSPTSSTPWLDSSRSTTVPTTVPPGDTAVTSPARRTSAGAVWSTSRSPVPICRVASSWSPGC